MNPAARSRGTLLACLLAGLTTLAGVVRAAPGTEILYEDRDPGAEPRVSRILIQGERLRWDYGRDDEDYILFDRAAGAIYLVAHAQRRVTVLPAAGPVRDMTRGARARLDSQASEGGRLSQLRVNGQLCAEFKNAPQLHREARLLEDFRRALARRQAATGQAAPGADRDDCRRAMDIREAGVEYRHGLLLALRQADGRVRMHLGHAERELAGALFELPTGYGRTNLAAGGRP